MDIVLEENMKTGINFKILYIYNLKKSSHRDSQLTTRAK